MRRYGRCLVFARRHVDRRDIRRFWSLFFELFKSKCASTYQQIRGHDSFSSSSDQTCPSLKCRHFVPFEFTSVVMSGGLAKRIPAAQNLRVFFTNVAATIARLS